MEFKSKYKCKVRYDGSMYYGFQRQSNLVSVQGEIERALSKVYNRKIEIISASRTDKGVHALMQVFHYETENNIPIEKLESIVNNVLNDDIYIYSFEIKDFDFHARYNVKFKTYRYNIDVSGKNDVFSSRYVLNYGSDLDIVRLNNIANNFIGKKDFKFVMASGSYKENTVRTVSKAIFYKSGDIVSFEITADGFLYKMVRMIVGAILDVYENKLTELELINAIKNVDRKKFKRVVSSGGLYLVDIEY
ncbi:MAG: tRNA pseudouridine(38-40) synthase TruA [Clostridiales bacterium]|nr:MAG: tRNA pseudouridine(38-40) synthase TruA [Clostridiales bacterium]